MRKHAEICVMLCSIWVSTSLNPIWAQQIPRQDIYLEIVGSQLLGTGVMYEYVGPLQGQHKYAIGAGLGFALESTTDEGPNYAGLFQPGFSYLYGQTHHLEIGAGIIMGTSFSDAGSSGFLPVGRLGYRYRPHDKGWMYRITLNPVYFHKFVFEDNVILPFLGVSIGRSF